MVKNHSGSFNVILFYRPPHQLNLGHLQEKVSPDQPQGKRKSRRKKMRVRPRQRLTEKKKRRKKRSQRLNLKHRWQKKQPPLPLWLKFPHPDPPGVSAAGLDLHQRSQLSKRKLRSWKSS